TRSKRDWSSDVCSSDLGDFDARVLISAAGVLCEPKMPEIEGISDFSGDVFHTARWDHSIPLAGRRVAVIGTGASAIQVVPSIASEGGHLDVYQRTAPWVLPRIDRHYPRLERSLYKKVPGLQRLVRGLQYVSREFQVVGLTRTRAALAPIRALGRAQLLRQVRDRDLRRKLTPRFK